MYQNNAISKLGRILEQKPMKPLPLILSNIFNFFKHKKKTQTISAVFGVFFGVFGGFFLVFLVNSFIRTIYLPKENVIL